MSMRIILLTLAMLAAVCGFAAFGQRGYAQVATPPAAPAVTDTHATPVSDVEKKDLAADAKAGHEGEGGGEHEKSLVDVNPTELIFTVVIFLALVVILRFTAWKPILAGLKARENAIRESIEAAAKAKADADLAAKDMEARIAEAQRQGAQAVAQAKADAQKLAESIRSQAEADANALKDRTVRDIQAAKQQAIADINAHAADLGTAIARKILQRNVTVGDQDRLVQESLAQLGTTRIEGGR